MRILKYFAYGIVLLVVATALLFTAARFADGPLGMIAGGPFSSGTPYVGDEPDWTFVREISTVEFQLQQPARSRTTWIVEYEGRIFIPCGYMNSTWGKLWKQWPVEAEKQGAAILRIDGRLYQRELRRIRDPQVVMPVAQRLSDKYGSGAAVETVDSGSMWLFEMAPI